MNIRNPNHNEPLHTPRLWSRLQNIHISNPTGWEVPFDIVTTVGATTYAPRSFNDEIPFYEFLFRFERSEFSYVESPDDLVLQLMGRGRMVSDPESEAIMQAAASALDTAYIAIDALRVKAAGQQMAIRDLREELQWHNVTTEQGEF